MRDRCFCGILIGVFVVFWSVFLWCFDRCFCGVLIGAFAVAEKFRDFFRDFFFGGGKDGVYLRQIKTNQIIIKF